MQLDFGGVALLLVGRANEDEEPLLKRLGADLAQVLEEGEAGTVGVEWLLEYGVPVVGHGTHGTTSPPASGRPGQRTGIAGLVDKGRLGISGIPALTRRRRRSGVRADPLPAPGVRRLQHHHRRRHALTERLIASGVDMFLGHCAPGDGRS
ncbi:hypothetical protein [Streptomyces sp. NPDC001816]|uniref:hypothetical protein n=1 Tax=Streptomyces sp. NPDC001816 TaxID=3364612 RepID=UPI00369B44B1